MYLKRAEIKNIRSLENIVWELDSTQSLAGWHVLIGDNGSGKSSLLQALSLGLIGPSQALRLNPDWNQWLRNDMDEGAIRLSVDYDFEIDRYSGQGRRFEGDIEIELNLINVRGESVIDKVELQEFQSSTSTGGARTKTSKRAYNYIWGNNKGWFSAAYGPFRRFSGSDAQMQGVIYSQEKVSAHASVFYESIALSNYRDWLKNIDYAATRGSGHEAEQASKLLDYIKQFINQDGFLPYGTHLREISPSVTTGMDVIFVDGNDKSVNVEQLGDGFRSILSMAFELIRQMTIQYDLHQIFSKDDPTKIIAPGVVLIDEVDAHLHPSWQRRIGHWFVEHFPNMQFIVTTHSPLVCQAAVHGTIWRLPAPGSGDASYQVRPDTEEWKRLVYGNVLEAYSTDLFGEDIDRSPVAQTKYERLAELSIKELDDDLSDDEAAEMNRLLAELPETPYKRTVGVMHD